MDYSKYEYTEKWFHENVALKTELHKHVDCKSTLNILEVGCFEGLSACYLSDNFLNSEGSMLHCVDPWFPSGSVEGITSKCITEMTPKMFQRNVSKSNNPDRVKTYTMTSDEFFKTNTEMFDVIYIDGNHAEDYIKRDIENAFKFCKKGGVIWFDDFGGHSKKYFDDKLKDYDFEILYLSYQLGIRVK